MSEALQLKRSPDTKAEDDVQDTGRGHRSLIKVITSANWTKVAL
jgi:hypothetical protein